MNGDMEAAVPSEADYKPSLFELQERGARTAPAPGYEGKPIEQRMFYMRDSGAQVDGHWIWFDGKLIGRGDTLSEAARQAWIELDGREQLTASPEPIELCACCACPKWGTGTPIPGVMFNVEHGTVERCDDCAIFEDDLSAAQALAEACRQRDIDSRVRFVVDGYDVETPDEDLDGGDS